MNTPIGYMEMTDHVFIPFYPYVIYGDFLDLLLLVIFHNPFISIGSYVFFYFSLSPPPIHTIRAIPYFHHDATCRQHSLPICLYDCFFSLSLCSHTIIDW